MKTTFSLLVLVACCGVICLMTSCLGETTVKAELVSPTGEYVAELSEGDTGAVGGWMSAVRVSETDPSLWTRLVGREGNTVFGVDLRSSYVTFAWITKNNLRITCSKCDASRIRLQKSTWRSVMISYEVEPQVAK
jgi:hypothetical protein